MREKIQELKQKYGLKLFTRYVKKDPELWKWVLENSDPKTHQNSISECVYTALTSEQKVCSNGKLKKFKGFNVGFVGCGKANTCECARLKVSESVKKTKGTFTEEQKIKTNKKREQTNLKKYGVSNTAQTQKAKQAHKKFYSKFIKKTPKGLLYHSYNKLKQKYSDIDVDFITPLEEYTGVSNQVYYNFKCTKCETEFKDYIDNGKLPKCKICNPFVPTYTSKQEQEVFDYIKSISNSAYQTDKSLINPYELDIVIPDLRIAVEYCGLYWHSQNSSNKDPKYHQQKMVLCNNIGYRLITIFEDEWLNKNTIVKNRLRNLLQVSKKIQARKTIIKEITNTESRDFCNLYHIQGSCPAEIHLGCFYNNKLVQVMTFGKPRYNSKFQYELIRLVSSDTVIGGPSKLFSYFIKKYNPESIVSYCDLRWGIGRVYEVLGFKCTEILNPGYYYTDYVNRFHRSNFTKKSLVRKGFSDNLTEQEIMQTTGYDRIWDCGNKRFEYFNLLIS